MQKIPASVLSGREIAGKIIQELGSHSKPAVSLVAVLVGENNESKSFLKKKEKVAQELGIAFKIRQFREDIPETDLLNEIRKLNADNQVGGIIIQLPLPKDFNREKVVSAINPKKDIDALNPENGLVLAPSVEVVKDILRTTNYELRTRIVAVVGAEGFLVGRPVSVWLEGKCRKLIKTDISGDLSKIKDADLVISGVGKAGLINPEMLKPGAGVIDFGYEIKEGKISGDFNASNVNGQMLNVVWYTPTPGGTGPILVAELLRNFYKLNKKSPK